MKLANELIIIGGGASIKDGLKIGLKKNIKNKFTCGLNYAFKYFEDCTYHCYVDKLFYEKQYIELEKLSLIIGKEHRTHVASNTITLSTATRYSRNLSGGVYSPDLVGLFALSLGIYLIDSGTIYLLGYDFGELHKKNIEDKNITDFVEYNKLIERDNKKRLVTHFYQGDFEHRGIGKTSYYKYHHRARNKFSAFITDKENQKKIKIYNVSPNSRIPNHIIEKIDYQTFFRKLNNEKYNQKELRQQIKQKLNVK